MIRWVLSPLVLVTVGIAAGLITLQLNLTGRVFDWPILITLGSVAAIAAYGLTFFLVRVERHLFTNLRDHPRHMWLVYPCWVLSSVGLGGGHGAILYIFPFAALSGVMIGNFVAIAHCSNRALSVFKRS